MTELHLYAKDYSSVQAIVDAAIAQSISTSKVATIHCGMCMVESDVRAVAYEACDSWSDIEGQPLFQYSGIHIDDFEVATEWRINIVTDPAESTPRTPTMRNPAEKKYSVQSVAGDIGGGSDDGDELNTRISAVDEEEAPKEAVARFWAEDYGELPDGHVVKVRLRSADDDDPWTTFKVSGEHTVHWRCARVKADTLKEEDNAG